MLEQIAYQFPRSSEQRRQTYFVVGDLESLSASVLYTGKIFMRDGSVIDGDSLGMGQIDFSRMTPGPAPVTPNFTPNTAYFPLTENGLIGVTHHSTGLGKLKVNENGTEYSVPIIDILDKPLFEWRIEKK